VGWRIWNLDRGCLRSWAVDYCWRPGENVASCLACRGWSCGSPPGQHCECGFWAVWSPLDCVVRACTAQEPPAHVLGLVAGWGTVALHGREGFRAERAALLCLFTDRPWAAMTRARGSGRFTDWLRQALGGPAAPAPELERESRHAVDLVEAAERYAVPLVSLRGAVTLGLLSELGVPTEHVEAAARLGARATTSA
jgi:hypothetical protein